MKVRNYLLIALVMLIVTGCASEVSDQELQGEEVLEDYEPVETETVASSDRDNYLRFSADLTCLVYGEEDMAFMEDHELDAFAQRYGYANMREAELEGEKYQGIQDSEEYLELLTENCPEYIDWVTGMGEGMTETIDLGDYTPAEIDLTASAYDRYVQMNVHMTCDPGISILEGAEADEMARTYGFANMAEAEMIPAQNPEVLSDVVNGLETACPDVHELFISGWS